MPCKGWCTRGPGALRSGRAGRPARGVVALALAAALVGLPGCWLIPKHRVPLPPPTRQPAPTPTPTPPAERPPVPPGAPEARPPAAPVPPKRLTPRARASLSLTAQGRKFLGAGKVDQAMATLERAQALDPENGSAAYWLAEAWLKKGDPGQATVYHRQAQLHLGGDAAWQGRLAAQARRLGVEP
ncbi:MAG: tetratricopeptide repeat protein [Deltaproteobacteria bacterium]|nr:tetratricopeptide repeat protein [Deltaproteobacteria bacterium]